ncbi:MAG: DNA recombination protein RmuC [Chitinophagaceae bacterium]
MLNIYIFFAVLFLGLLLLTLLYVFVQWKAGLQTIRKQENLLNSHSLTLQTIQAEKEKLLIEKVKLTTENGYLQQKLQEQQQQLSALNEQLKASFYQVAQKVLEEKSASFSQLNQEKLNQILTPFQQSLQDLKSKVEQTYQQESKERFALGKEIEKLVNTTIQVSKEANNLTTALKGNTKMQGNWGEMLLESILENSGLTKNREYWVQEFIKDSSGNTIKDAEGKSLQPDITIKYPDERLVIIDSKVSLLAWEQYCSAADIAQQQQFLQQHIQSLKNHINNLSKKNYAYYAKALDYVLLFIPIEPAFLEAVKEDVQLWKYAYDKRILLVSPTNLLAVLKIVADLWKIEKQNQHAIAIAEKAGLLYDKFVGFAENMEKLGNKLTETQTIYQAATNQLWQGKGNLVTKTEELRKMGANSKKQLPDKWLRTADEDYLTE